MKKTFIAVAAVLLSQVNPAFSQEGPFVDNFDDGVLSESRFRVRTNNDNSTVIVDNGMVRLEATSDGTVSGRSALDLVEQTNFIQADIKLDSTSMAEGNGMSRVMLSGALYNDSRPGGVEDGGSIGDVLAQLSVRLRGDGTLSSLICAFRSNDADFGDITTIVIDGFTECGQFETDIQFGVPYTASIFIDLDNRKLVFKLDGETVEHIIRGNIFEPSPRGIASVLALSNGVGTAVAFADNVSNSVNAVTEVETPVETPVEIPEETPDDSVGEPVDEIIDENTDEVPADDIVNEVVSGSSSGCSISGTSATNDPMLLILASLALLIPALRRKSLRPLATSL